LPPPRWVARKKLSKGMLQYSRKALATVCFRLALYAGGLSDTGRFPGTRAKDGTVSNGKAYQGRQARVGFRKSVDMLNLRGKSAFLPRPGAGGIVVRVDGDHDGKGLGVKMYRDNERGVDGLVRAGVDGRPYVEEG
jgi:hypothetical protein